MSLLQFVLRQQQKTLQLPYDGSAAECFPRGLQGRVAVHRGPSATHDHDVPRGALGVLDATKTSPSQNSAASPIMVSAMAALLALGASSKRVRAPSRASRHFSCKRFVG